jgi:hypothetical protein
MFDQLFSFVGPVSTATALVALLAVATVFVSYTLASGART